MMLPLLPEVQEVFNKEHGQDIVLILGSIDDASEGITSFPNRSVDIF